MYYLDTMNDVVLWVESGIKCALLNMQMDLIRSDTIKMFPIQENGIKNYIQLAYANNCSNYTLEILKNYLLMFLPTLYNLYKVVKNPKWNPYTDLTVEKTETGYKYKYIDLSNLKYTVDHISES